MQKQLNDFKTRRGISIKRCAALLLMTLLLASAGSQPPAKQSSANAAAPPVKTSAAEKDGSVEKKSAKSGSAPLVKSKQGMVVTVSPAASDVGLAILERGGNAVDSAVATAVALAVTFPEAGNMGGGGVMLVWPREGKDPVFHH